MKKPYISNYINTSNYIKLNFKRLGSTKFTEATENSDTDGFSLNSSTWLTKSTENSDTDE